MTSDLTQSLRQMLLALTLVEPSTSWRPGGPPAASAWHTWAVPPSSPESRRADTDHMRDVHSAQTSKPPRSRRCVDCQEVGTDEFSAAQAD